MFTSRLFFGCAVILGCHSHDNTAPESPGLARTSPESIIATTRWRPGADETAKVLSHDSSFFQPLDAEVAATVPGATFAQRVQIRKNAIKAFRVAGLTVIEDSATRFWTEQKPVPQYTEWQVEVPGRPNCEVIIRFAPKPGNEALAKKIAATLRPAA